jgi:peptidoglycan/xylan/chitin deacetylase (PgdA/CDA1 family)
LKTLKEENVKATFFVLARHLDPVFSGHWQRNQQTLREIVRQGHVVGSHSYNHPNFVQAGSWATEQDMKKADDLFKKILGFSPRFMRPPEG